MKKILLATCYFQPNYGSILQAFATQEFFNINGIPNMTINISGISGIIKQRKMAYFKRNIFNKDIVIDKLSHLKLIVYKRLDRKLNENIRKRVRLLNKFSQSKFNLTYAFTDFSELTRACAENVDAVLVGSDQLWLPTNIEADYYTLNFVPDNIKKISYSTSFGVSYLPAVQASKAIKFLSRFDYLGVREQSGVSLVEKLINKTPKLVCDPVILLTADQWLNIVGNTRFHKEDYILCYLLGNERKHYLWVKKLSKFTGLKIIGLTNSDTFVNIADKIVDLPKYDAGPFDFVSLIQNAKYVCTDSFHATVFALLFQKNVFTFRRFVKQTAMSTNGRLESLYRLFGEDRPFTSADTPIKKALNFRLNYENVNKALANLRISSIEYLSEVLNVKLY